jgi:hypothetical protein
MAASIFRVSAGSCKKRANMARALVLLLAHHHPHVSARCMLQRNE